MWISQAAYLRSRDEYAKALAEKDAAVALTLTQKATLEWLMVRMTQLEAERAKLLWTYMGVKVPVMAIEQEPAPTQMDNPLNALPNFNDLGDHEANRLGIAWNDAGEITYDRR